MTAARVVFFCLGNYFKGDDCVSRFKPWKSDLMLLTPGKPVYFNGGACEIRLPECGKLFVIPSLLAENLALVSLLGWPQGRFLSALPANLFAPKLVATRLPGLRGVSCN
jgi:hypothetical protein